MAGNYYPNLPPDTPRTIQEGFRKAFDFIYELRSRLTTGTSPVALEGTHRERGGIPAASLPIGSTFTETDRSNIVYIVRTVAGAPSWAYDRGTHRCALADRPTDLGTLDAGFLLFTTTYLHLHRWTGSGWEWGPGDEGSAFIRSFAVVPGGAGWTLVDGATNPIVVELGDCSTANIPVGADARGYFPIYANAYSGTPNAETAGTVTGTAAATATPAFNTAAGVGPVAQQSHAHSVTGTSTGAKPPNFEVMPYMRQ